VSKNRKLRDAVQKQPPNRVAELRQMRGLSQTDLGTLCRMGKSSIARVENGESGMDLADMRAIARALRVKASELLVESDVEIRLDPGARTALEGLGPEEINMVMQAAAGIARLVKRLSPTRGAALTGDPETTTRMADMWNEMDIFDQANVLGIVQAARNFRPPPVNIAAE
jgi:transcriptional regulator with XRE-family HTH domain